MKLWTIQPVEWYEKLFSDGIIYGEKHLIENIKICENFDNSYQWMISQMGKRLGNKPFADAYPIWAWYQYENAQKQRPDLRNSALLERGTKGVRIEIEKKDEEVLLSDFMLWTHPLNFWKISDNDDDDNEFDKKLEEERIKFSELNIHNAPKHIREEIENSWEKILDMNYCLEYVANPFEKKSIQATFWSLSIDEVKNVDYFTAK